MTDIVIGACDPTGKPLFAIPASEQAVAGRLETTRKTLSAIINGKQSVTPEMAIRLATALANATPEFWLTVQENYDLVQARRKVDTSNVRVFWKPSVFITQIA